MVILLNNPPVDTAASKYTGMRVGSCIVKKDGSDF